MPRFCANLSTMFGELEFFARIAAAADAGFKAVECQWPYEWPAQEVSRQLLAHDIPMVLINAPAGDWSAGERGLAAMPGSEAEFMMSIERAIDYACEIKCGQLHVLAGVSSQTAGPGDLRKLYIENICRAAERCSLHDIRVLIEPINTHDVTGYYMSRTAEALHVINVVRAAGIENVDLQYDFYHSHRMGEDLHTTLDSCIEYAGHIQISGFPGRHEPDIGEIAYEPLFEMLDTLDYGGWVGCEYTPRSTTLDGLAWAQGYGICGGAD